MAQPAARAVHGGVLDAIVVKARDGQPTNRPAYCAIGVTADGTRDILAIWIGTGGEGAKCWLQVLTEITNHGTQDVCIVVCDGLKGLPESIEATWPLAVIRTSCCTRSATPYGSPAGATGTRWPRTCGRRRWMNRWKPALNAFAITFEERPQPTSDR